jgi:heme A synthase
MLVLLVVSGLRIGSGLAVHVTLAILFPAIAVVCWGIWAAPTSRRRLDDPPRLVAQIVLFVITGVLAVAAHLPVWGVAFTVVAVAAFSLTRVFPSRPQPTAGSREP